LHGLGGPVGAPWTLLSSHGAPVQRERGVRGAAAGHEGGQRAVLFPVEWWSKRHDSPPEMVPLLCRNSAGEAGTGWDSAEQSGSGFLKHSPGVRAKVAN
jgi:hypothetical protein